MKKSLPSAAGTSAPGGRFRRAASLALALAIAALLFATCVPLAYVPRRPLVPALFGHLGLYLALVLAISGGVVARAAHRHPAARRRARSAFYLAGVAAATVAATWLFLLVRMLRR